MHPNHFKDKEMSELILEIVSKKDQFIAKTTFDEMMLVPLKNDVVHFNQFLTLNEVGAFIWEQIEASDTLNTLTTKVCNEFEVSEKLASDDILTFLDDLNRFIQAT